MKPNLVGGLAAALFVASATLAVTSADAATTGAAKDPSPKALARASAQALVDSRAPQLRVSNADRFHAEPVVSGGNDLQYAPYTRSYRGLDVYGGDFVVMTDAAGHILGTSVAQQQRIGALSTDAKVSSSAARSTAQQGLHGASAFAPELVVHALAKPRLAWEVNVAGHDSDGDFVSERVYVSATTGKVIDRLELMHRGTGTGAYNGPSPLTIGTSGSGTSFSMRDPNITNLSCAFNNGTVMTGTDNVWGNGSKTDQETSCVDSLYVADTENQMLSQWLGRNSFDGNGGAWPIRTGLNDINAFYCPQGGNCGANGSTERLEIGHNQAGEWISTLDVVGHEMGHGVDNHTPGGISRSGTQEFVADVFGALTEHYANESTTYDEPDYLVGEEVNLVGQGPIRNMYNPSAAGDPNCYSSSIPTGEVHASAGPGNHWFYLLAEGTNPSGGPTSTTCNGSGPLAGIGIQTAGKIFYNAMLMKTTSSSYLKYRTWTLTAAKNLYPGSCDKFNAVKAAWNAVSVPAQTGDPTCTTTGNTVTVNNPGNRTGTVGTATSLQMTGSSSGSGQTLTWSATGLPAGLSINASTGLISGTPTTAATYNVTVTAKDTTNAQGSTSFTWTISGTGGGCSSPGQKLGNPGFETGTAAPWSASAGVIDNSTGQPARTGSWKAWLDGYGSTHTDTLSQSVSIPSGCAATLSFYLHIDSAETTTSVQYDKLTVKIGATTLATYSNLNKASGYQLRSFNVSSFAGQTVTVSFTGVEDSSLQTSFVVDDTALTVS